MPTLSIRRSLVAAAALAAAVACGNSSSNFVGTWSTDLTVNSVCVGDSGSGTSGVQDALNIVLGTGSDIKSTDFEGCALTYTLSGNTATATVGQSCQEQSMAPDGSIVNTTVTYTNYTLTTKDGKNMTISGSLAATTTNPDGSQLTCNDTITGTGIKENAPDGG